MEILEPDEKNRLERKTSIYQNRGMLSVRKGDEWVPLAYDVLDGFNCDKVLTHKAVLTLKPYIGYQFPVANCRYVSDAYLLSSQKGKELKKLPEFYGAGFYESYYDRDILINADNGALGITNDITVRVGLDYVDSKETLDPAPR